MAFISDVANAKPVVPIASTSALKSEFDRGKGYLKKILLKRSENRIELEGGIHRDTYNGRLLPNKTRAFHLDPSTQPKLYNDETLQSDWSGDEENLAKDVKNLAILQNTDLYTRSSNDLITKNIVSYNRFKLPFTTNALSRTTSHVFFTRPNCNFFNGDTLTTTANVHPTISSVYMRNPFLLTGLTHNTPGALKQFGNFNLLLSNAATSFQLTDEYIDTGESAETLDGHKIPYGKLNTKSKASGSFTVTFDDDRNLSIYQQLKVWVDYISAVYIGEVEPTYSSVINRELDYPANVYYILTAEDGYTILFWSKYYGVFPKTIPSSQYSWNKGNSLNMPSLNVEFQYAFKEDYILSTIEEFNTDSFYGMTNMLSSVPYEPIYDEKLGMLKNTWVGLPFIDVKRPSGGNNTRSINNLVCRLMFATGGASAKT